MTICYIGLGSNLGSRKLNIKKAILHLKELKTTKVLKVSRIISSRPAGGPARQENYLNAVVKIETGLSLFSLLKEIKDIEKRMGRKKTARWGPRLIDIDILLYGKKSIKSAILTVPHPRMFNRPFVIKPLLEVT
jgi:2-amino-4-hydroxy-6-hydroxymethyldihydropteridine diphosphokinase